MDRPFFVALFTVNCKCDFCITGLPIPEGAVSGHFRSLADSPESCRADDPHHAVRLPLLAPALSGKRIFRRADRLRKCANTTLVDSREGKMGGCCSCFKDGSDEGSTSNARETEMSNRKTLSVSRAMTAPTIEVANGTEVRRHMLPVGRPGGSLLTWL